MGKIINFEQLTPQMIQDLGDIIFAESVVNGTISDYMTVVPAVSGKRIPVLYQLSKIGKVSRGCTPSVDEASADLVEKKWALQEWDFRLKQCYKDVAQSLYALGLNVDVNRPDMTGTALMELLISLIEPAVDEMVQRFAWFGDTEAKNVAETGGGSITAGVDPEYFKVVDGAWKQIYAMTTENKGIKHISIAPNTETTTAKQEAAAGYSPKSTLLDVINSAPIQLRNVESGRKQVLVTDLFMKKLKNELLSESIQTESQFVQRQDGIEELRLFGQSIVSMPYWDKEITESFNNGTKLDNPYRVLYTTKDNLLLGTPQKDTGNTGSFEEFKVWYEQKDRQVYIDGMGLIDTKVVRPELISVAY